MKDLAPLVVGVSILLSIAVCVIILSIAFPDNSPKHPDFDWRGECGDKSGYWYDTQVSTKACLNTEGKMTTCTSTTRVFQKDMTEGEFTKYCLRGER